MSPYPVFTLENQNKLGYFVLASSCLLINPSFQSIIEQAKNLLCAKCEVLT